MTTEQLDKGILIRKQHDEYNAKLDLVKSALKSDSFDLEVVAHRGNKQPLRIILLNEPDLFDTIFLLLQEALEQKLKKNLAEFESL